MIVEELIAKLGFKFDDTNLKKFDSGMQNAKKLLSGLAVVAGGYAVAMLKSTEAMAEQNDILGKQAETLGITTAELQSFQYAAELGGASSSDMSSSLENLGRVASQASRGIGAGVETFGLLGISVNDANGNVKSSTSLMSELSDKISKLSSQSEKLEFLQNLGVSNKLLLTLNQGAKELNKQREEAKKLGFLLSPEDTKNAADFNDALLKVHKVMKGLTSQIATKSMPIITKLMTQFKVWFINNKKIIQQNITKFLENMNKVLGGVWAVIKRVSSAINSIARAFGGWEKTIKVVGSALLVLNAKALILPITLIAIGVAVGLLLEDLISYYNGSDSAIGDLAKKHEFLKKALEALRQILKQVADGWTLIFTKGGDALDGLGIYIKSIGKHIFDFMIAPLNAVLKLINKVTGSDLEIKNPLDGGYDAVGEDAKDIKDSVKNYLLNPTDVKETQDNRNFLNPSTGGEDSFFNALKNFLNPSTGGFTTPQMVPVQTRAFTTNNSTTTAPMNFHANITVNGGNGDGKTIGADISSQLDTWFKSTNKKAQNNLRGAIAR